MTAKASLESQKAYDRSVYTHLVYDDPFSQHTFQYPWELIDKTGGSFKRLTFFLSTNEPIYVDTLTPTSPYFHVINQKIKELKSSNHSDLIPYYEDFIQTLCKADIMCRHALLDGRTILPLLPRQVASVQPLKKAIFNLTDSEDIVTIHKTIIATTMQHIPKSLAIQIQDILTTAKQPRDMIDPMGTQRTQLRYALTTALPIFTNTLSTKSAHFRPIRNFQKSLKKLELLLNTYDNPQRTIYLSFYAIQKHYRIFMEKLLAAPQDQRRQILQMPTRLKGLDTPRLLQLSVAEILRAKGNTHIIQGLIWHKPPNPSRLNLSIQYLYYLIANGPYPEEIILKTTRGNKNSSWTISKDPEGIRLSTFINLNPEKLQSFDPFNFSALIILGLLTDPINGLPQNFTVKSFHPQNIMLIWNNITAAFAIDPEDIQYRPFSLPQMHNAISPAFCTHFLSLSPQFILFQWLTFIMQNCHFHLQNSITTLCTKIQTIQTALQENPSLTHYELLKIIHPTIVHKYQRANPKNLPLHFQITHPDQQISLKNPSLHSKKNCPSKVMQTNIDSSISLSALENCLAKLDFSSLEPKQQQSIFDQLPKNLENLIIHASQTLSDDTLMDLSKRCQNLQKLTLRGCHQVTLAGLNAIICEHRDIKLTIGSCHSITAANYGFLYRNASFFSLHLITGAIIDTKNSLSLHHAIHAFDEKAFYFQLSIQAPVMGRDPDGNTPLHTAVKAALKDMPLALDFITLLYFCGATQTPNSLQITPADLAKDCELTQLVNHFQNLSDPKKLYLLARKRSKHPVIAPFYQTYISTFSKNHPFFGPLTERILPQGIYADKDFDYLKAQNIPVKIADASHPQAGTSYIRKLIDKLRPKIIILSWDQILTYFTPSGLLTGDTADENLDLMENITTQYFTIGPSIVCIESFRMRRDTITPEILRRLCSLLPKSYTLSLYLTNVDLQNDHALPLAQSIANSRLETVDLSNNPIDSTALTKIIKLIAKPPLKNLYLNFSSLNDQALIELAPTLGKANLNHISLAYCDDITHKGLQALNNHLPKKTTIYIEPKKISYNTCVELLPLVPRLSLTFLNLDFHPITGIDLNKLAPAFVESFIEVLHLECNEIDDQGAPGLFTLLTMPNLTELNLERNKIGDLGAAAIAKALPSSHLRTFNLAGNPIKNQGLAALSSALPHSPHLKTLRLSSIDIDNQTASLLADGIKKSNLLNIYLLRCNIQDDGAISLAMAFYSSKLIYLNLINNPITKRGINAFRHLGLSVDTTKNRLVIGRKKKPLS